MNEMKSNGVLEKITIFSIGKELTPNNDKKA